MAARYKAYPEYRDSGVAWIDRVPKQWNLLRHKYVSNFYKGKNPSALLDSQKGNTFRYLSMDYLRGGAEAKYAKIEPSSYITEEGQVLIIWDGSNAGEFVRGASGILSSTMAAAELICEISPQFYWYACACLEPEMRKHANGMGIPHVNGHELRNSYLPVPLRSEQKQIARFLDHETGKIDLLIEKQQALIALLKEKRQAVISHAVTKGLNPHAPMKDSGVEWLGEVPEHWMVVQLGKKIQLQRGVDITKDQQIEGKIPVVSSGGVSSYHNVATCTGPGVLVGRKGTAGKLHYIESDFWAHDTTLYVKEFRGNDVRYTYYKLLSMKLEDYDTGSANPTLNRNNIHPEHVSWPPIEEQHEIVKYLDAFIQQADLIELKSVEAINLLQERRTALISAAVTGKIDVRDWEPEPQSF